MAVAYRASASAGNSSGGNLTINKPTGTVDNDIMSVILYSEHSSTAWTLPSGWAWWGGATGQVIQQGGGWVFMAWKRASSEGSSYTFTHAGSAWRVGVISSFSGAFTSGDPEDSTGPTGNNGTGSVNVLASITTSTANSMLVGGAGNYPGITLGVASSGMSLAGQLGGTGIVYVLQAAAGASGTKTLSDTSDAGSWASWHVAIKEASSGTQYNQSVDGGITPSGALAKLTSKTFSGGVTPTGTVTKQTNKPASGSIAPSGSITKQTNKVTGGDVALSGVIIKNISKMVSGALSSITGSLNKTTSKTMAGGITPGGIVESVRTFLVSVGGSITPTGAIGKSIEKILSGNVTPSGTISKAISKSLSGSITPSGSIIKQIAKSISGVISSIVGALESILSGSSTEGEAALSDYTIYGAGLSDYTNNAATIGDAEST